MTDLTDDEKKAIRALQRLAKTWPKTLWIFAGDGALAIMRCTEDGERASTPAGGVDQTYEVARVQIPSDGGGW